ncbi:hypothetical protein AX15_000858 [Amanita polypyramis BW_CC]|nr:hypothetical protein AX15_000858 [Amanita polypyramis BW_CC]
MVDERQRIIASVFSRRNAQGVLEESYVSHIKIWEDADGGGGGGGGGKKLRYILLSQARSGAGYMHKSKLNSNGSFSIGKTWLLADLRAIHVLNPLTFNITLSRTYRWQADNQTDQLNFLHALILLFRSLSTDPLRLEGVTEPDPSAANTPAVYDHSLRSTHSSSPSSRQGDLTPAKVRETQVTPASQTTLHSLDNRHQSDTDLTVVDIPPINLHAVPTDVSLDKKALLQSSLLHSPSGSRTPSPTPSPRIRKLPSSMGTNAETNGPVSRKDPKARISFFDLNYQGIIERLLSSNAFSQSEIEGEEETAQATMSNVEEMLEGYDWASDDVIGRKNTKGAVDLIEARLTGELMALENANIHSFLESDNQVMAVIRYIDEAIGELDNLDETLSSYKIHLNVSPVCSRPTAICY